LDILGGDYSADPCHIRYLGIISLCFERVEGIQVEGIEREEI
jgi:hypothetical protein